MSSRSKAAVFIGDMRLGTNSRSIFDGLVRCGFETTAVDVSRSVSPKVGSALWRSIRDKRKVTPDENERLRQELLTISAAGKPDLVLAVKSVLYDQNIILDMTGKRVHLSFDDVSNPDNISPQYLAAEAGWDLIATTKRHNIPELQQRGVKSSLFIWGAYDPKYRQNRKPVLQRDFNAGFIGAARPDRTHLPRILRQLHPELCTVIYGPRWRRSYPFGLRGVEIRPNVTRESFTDAANSIQVGLVLLNSDNRDQHTNRTFESPATGQMVLAQRTPEHEELFDDGREALFFSSLEEIPGLVLQISKQPHRLQAIAEAGFRKVVGGRNTWSDRVEEIVSHVL